MYKPTTTQQHSLYENRDSGDFVDSSLNGLMRDVDSYISELNEEQLHSDQRQYQAQVKAYQNKSTAGDAKNADMPNLYSNSPTPPVQPSQHQYQQQLSPGNISHSRASSASSFNYHKTYNAAHPSGDYFSSSNKHSDEISLPMPEPYHPYSSTYYQPQLASKPKYTPTTSATIIEPSMPMPTPDFYYGNTADYSQPPPLQPQQTLTQPLDYVDMYIKRQQQEKIAMHQLEETADGTSNLSSSKTTSVTSQLKHSSSNTSSSYSIASSTLSQSNSYAYLSNLSKAFVKRIQGLEHVRELFCANEYPESFTGQEAITILNSLLDGIPESYCVTIANALMNTKPSLFEPIHYSQKSIIQSKVFNSPDEYYTLHDDNDLTDEDNVPNGILTSLVDCYTVDCLPGKGGCYAPKCPNKPEIFEEEFNQFETVDDSNKRPLSASEQQEDQSSTVAAIAQQTAWSQRVSKELLQSLSKKEIERQEAINELIYSEYVYKRDLETLSEVIIEPLLSKTIIPATKREDFVKEVFTNYKELNEISNALYQDLLQLQHEHNRECIPLVGDILLKHFAYFEEPFTKYCPRASLAEYLVKAEERHNPHFQKFIAHTERSKRMRRLAFRHFLLNPVTRMQRYPLLLDAIIKKTEETHADYLYLAKAIDMVKKVASTSDQLAEIYKQRVGILEINDMITFKQGEFQDLQLTQPQRKLYYQGDIKRRSNGIEVTEKSDIHIFIFDHMILMTKPRKSPTSSHTSSAQTSMSSSQCHQQQLYPHYDEYRVWRRPIPLQMLHVGSTSDYSTNSSSFYSHNSSPNQSSLTVASAASNPSSRNFNLSISTGYVMSGSAFIVPSSSNASSTSTSNHTSSSTTTSFHHTHYGSSYLSSSGLTPLTLHHLGQRGGIYTFLCTIEEKQKWLQAIEDAKISLKKRLGEDVFDLILLDDTSFRYVATTNGTSKHGKVNCTVPFMSVDNVQKLAVGTDTGVYFKSFDSPVIKKVLSCENVTQLALLDKFHILLVLADKTLKAYSLDYLNSPPTNSKTSPEKTGQEIAQHVHFFQVGHCNDKDLVVFKKKKNTSSIFTALEPLYDLRDPKNQKYIAQKTGFMLTNRSNHSWFKKYKEFYVGAESSNVHFLKSKLLIVCERGFEIIDPENLSVGGRDIPDKGDPQFNFVHRNIDSNKPLAMYRVQDKFLLCYNKFAFYVNNRNGSLVQRGPQKLPVLCEWEGNPDHIVYQYPYILAFDSQFIEIRHVDTGDLVQIIPGDQIRLTYYQTMNDTTMIQGCMTHLQRPEMQTLFCLNINAQRSSNNLRKLGIK